MPAWLTGFLVGAGTGAIARSAVALVFLAWAEESGERWYEGTKGPWPLAIASAGIGFFIGGVSGLTCRPILGTFLGGFLSGSTCLVLVVLPSQLMMGLSGGGAIDYSAAKSAHIAALVGMIVAGMIAGGVGAFAGRLRRVKPG